MQNAAEKKPFRVLVVGAEPALLTALEALLRRKGFEVTAASTAVSSRLPDEGELDVALLDLGPSDADGPGLLAAVKQRQPDVEVVALVGAPGRAAAQAVEAGAYDCLVRPLEDEERVALAVQRAAERRRLLARARWLEGRLAERGGGAGEAVEGVVTGPGAALAPRAVPAANGEDPGWLGQSYAAAKEDALRRFESAYVERLMRDCRDNISAAARKAGMDRSNFKRVLRKYRGELKDGDEAPRAPRSASA